MSDVDRARVDPSRERSMRANGKLADSRPDREKSDSTPMQDAPRRAFIYYSCHNRHKGCVTRHLILDEDWMRPEVSGMFEREGGGFACKRCYEDMVEVTGAAKARSKSSERRR